MSNFLSFSIPLYTIGWFLIRFNLGMKSFLIITLHLFSSCLFSQTLIPEPCQSDTGIVCVRLPGYKPIDFLTKKELLQIEGVEAEKGRFEILACKIYISSGSGFCCEDGICEVQLEKGMFNKKVLSYFKVLQKGSTISFECTIAKDRDGNFVWLQRAFYTIK